MRRRRIFINYRRDDSRADSGRLYDRLLTRFPSQVFRDVGSLEPGVEWHEAIARVNGVQFAVTSAQRQLLLVTENRRGPV